MTSAPKGGGGVSGKADEGRELSKGGCVNLRTRGGRGSKNPNILRTSLMEATFMISSPPPSDSPDPLDVGRPPRRGRHEGDGSVRHCRDRGADEEERAEIQTGANVQVFI